ncbi:hypothetical protein [Opitutus terrae]|uniref:Uncharacterized protein n=1 Tax=Opitutus terrae (strain DSM 11246 / JCM 15787 / PB90-1) TaxID=452637 RepID=B1ZTH9_OPITP|nr:hypothetical protein [Opitutus terrae]ACB73924.1 hypothetical protein Oter_0634 [Opitutus terrae PB90-1]
MKSKKQTVTLEDLLRVKRAERPPPEFWAEFDREMRAKQLAAIIEPRPWWAPFIRVGARMSHYQLPAGAAAILALSFLTLSKYQTAPDRPTFVGDAAPVAVESLPETTLQLTPAEPELASPMPTAEQIASIEPEDQITLPESPVSPGRAAHAIALLGERPMIAEPSPSARAIAANLAAAEEADPQIMNELFGTVMSNVDATERPRDPLARISPPGESRRSRLLATALPVPAGYSEVEVGTSDRVVRRLTEDRLYDTISRIGVRGDRVAIKF